MEFPTSKQTINPPSQHVSERRDSTPSSPTELPWQHKLFRRFTSRGATKGRSNNFNASLEVDSGCNDSRIRRYSMGSAPIQASQSRKEGKRTRRARAKSTVDQHARASPRTSLSPHASKNASVAFSAEGLAYSTVSFASSPSLEQRVSYTSERTITATNISSQVRAPRSTPDVDKNLDPDALNSLLSTSPRRPSTCYTSPTHNTSGVSQPSTIRHSEPHVTPNNSPSARGADMGVVERTRSVTVGNDSRPYASIGRNGSLRGKEARTGSPLINSYTSNGSTPIPDAPISPRTPTFQNPFDSEALSSTSAPRGDQTQEQSRRLHGSRGEPSSRSKCWSYPNLTPSGSKQASLVDATGRVRGATVGSSPGHGRKKGQGIGVQASRSVEVEPIFMPSPREGKASKFNAGSPPSFSSRRGSIACPAPAHITSLKSSPHLGGKGLGIGYVGLADRNAVSRRTSDTVQVDGMNETGRPKEETLTRSVSMSAATTEARHIDGPNLRPTIPIQIKYVGEALGQSAVKTETLMMNAHMQELENMSGRALEEEQNAHAVYNNAYFDFLTAQAHFMEAQASLNIAKTKMETSGMVLKVCVENAVNAAGAVMRWSSSVNADEKLRY